jgi:hypothetical protein
MPTAHVEKRHFTAPDTGSYDYSYTSLNVIQYQEAYRKQIVTYCKGKNMKRVEFIT